MLLFIIPAVVSGQTRKGSLLIGGGSQLSLSRLNTNWESNLKDSLNTTTMEFSPQFGFFISNSLVLGAKVPLKRETESVGTQKEIVTYAAIGPFLRYYPLRQGNVMPYLQGMFGPGHVRKSKSWDKEIISYGMLAYEIDLGMAFFANEYISFDLVLGYAYTRYNRRTSFDHEQLDVFFTRGLGIKLGLTALL
ncbi:MAG: hypothetical protein EA361_14145 [Bacteroidetes bacterium]|nr:MAG: hypothetical protein EA361_14145 [Bacteroidota bacterium]